MIDTEQLQAAILEKLSSVIDPETGADVVRMKLVDDLVVESNGRVTYTIRPSSPLCTIAVFLAVQIKKAVADVIGVKDQTITVKDYVEAEALTGLINQMNL
jgi:metal-sulfur cluster biosynthetic enzyme